MDIHHVDSLTVVSLENMLRSFACLSTDDVISIKYNERASTRNDTISIDF